MVLAEEVVALAVAALVEAGNNDYFELGIKLFNHEEYFLAHECFEILWNNTKPTDEKRLFYQALVQTSVGFYHLKREDKVNSLAQFNKAINKLEKFLPLYDNLDIFALFRNLLHIVDCLNNKKFDKINSNFPKLIITK